MRSVGSLFSGVGGFDQGFERAGFRTAWQVEVDRDAVSVLERHWPAVRRHGDIREVDPASLEPVDVITFGSPCQDFSVAGKRAGMAGERSGLFGEAIRIIRGVRPAFAVWENVPGALSSAGGRDFGAVLDALADVGALDISWRVLDARFWGVAQRRRRIFLVADFRAERAASVLFEPARGGRDSEACREAGQGTAGDAEDGTGVVSWKESQSGVRESDVVGVLDANYGSRRHNGVMTPVAAESGNRTSGPIDVATACNAHGGPHGRQEFESETFLVANAVSASAGHHGHSSPRGDGSDNKGVGAVAFHMTQDPINGAVSPALSGNAYVGVADVAAISENQRAEVRETPYARQITAGGGKPSQGFAAVREALTVRRLTPTECCRLMGWPDAVKTVTIHVWNEPHSGESLKTNAPVVTPCLRLPSSASPARGNGCLRSASLADQASCTHHPDHEQPVALSVYVDLGSMVVEIRSPDGLLWRASNVDGSGWSDLRVNDADFVRQSALIASILERTTRSGAGASHRSAQPSTPQPSGDGCVSVSGHEIELRAADVAIAIDAATHLLTSTTSGVWSSSGNFDSILTTLCCSVLAVISGFIPGRIRNAPSFVCALTVSHTHTQFRADGSLLPDGTQYRMIGNGVVAPVAEWLGRRLMSALDGMP